MIFQTRDCDQMGIGSAIPNYFRPANLKSQFINHKFLLGVLPQLDTSLDLSIMQT